MDAGLINTGNQHHGIPARGRIDTDSTSSAWASIEFRGDYHPVQSSRPDHRVELDQEHHL